MRNWRVITTTMTVDKRYNNNILMTGTQVRIKYDKRGGVGGVCPSKKKKSSARTRNPRAGRGTTGSAKNWTLSAIGVGHVVRAGYACAAHRPHGGGGGGGDGSDRPAHWCAAVRACVLYSVRRPSDVLHAFAHDICRACSPPPKTRGRRTHNNCSIKKYYNIIVAPFFFFFFCTTDGTRIVFLFRRT